MHWSSRTDAFQAKGRFSHNIFKVCKLKIVLIGWKVKSALPLKCFYYIVYLCSSLHDYFKHSLELIIMMVFIKISLECAVKKTVCLIICWNAGLVLFRTISQYHVTLNPVKLNGEFIAFIIKRNWYRFFLNHKIWKSWLSMFPSLGQNWNNLILSTHLTKNKQTKNKHILSPFPQIILNIFVQRVSNPGKNEKKAR